MSRSYTLAEIDAMRCWVQRRRGASRPNIVHMCPPGGGWSTETPESVAANAAWARVVEDELRTLMQGGVDPKELETLPDAS